MSNEKSYDKSHSKHSSHHHHSHSSGKYKYYSKEEDMSSKMERMGKNIIYDNVRKEKMMLALKRGAFSVVFLALIAFVLFSIFKNPDSSTGSGFLNKNTSREEIIELKNKVTKYEFYIEELEERLSQYEEVQSIFEE